MAKASPIIGLDCETEAHTAASQVLSVRFEEMTSFSGAAASPDTSVDGIHDMRVASRRLRSAVRDFSGLYRKKQLKPLKKNLKKLARELGVVRDVDVYLETLRKKAGAAPTADIKVGLDSIIEKHVDDRSGKYSSLVEKLAPESLAKLNGRLNNAVSDESRKAKADETENFRQLGREVIRDLVDTLSDRGEAIVDPLNGDALHRLRIMAKRLRYALELFDECFGGGLRVYAKNLSKLQNRLGAVHDLDVWSDGLATGEGEEQTFETEATRWLNDEFQRERAENYQAAFELWNESISPKLVDEIRDIIST